jgi:HEAT repeat protein
MSPSCGARAKEAHIAERGCSTPQFLRFVMSAYTIAQTHTEKTRCPFMFTKLKAVLAALQPKRGLDIEHWLAQLAKTDARSRWEAIEALALHGNMPRVREALIVALGDPHPFVRWQAGEVLSRSTDERSFSALEAVLASRSSRQRSAAADALGKLGDDRATDALCRALNSRNTDVRRSAAEALARLGDTAALPALHRALRDRDPFVRRAAVSAMGTIRKPEVMPALLAMLQDESPLVRAAAAGALGRIGHPAAAISLRQALQDPYVGVRWQAVQALSATGDTTDLPALEPFLQDDTEVFGRSIADATRDAVETIRRRQQKVEQERRRS